MFLKQLQSLDFAAASKTLVSATVSNKGTADITATAGKISTSDNPPIVDKVFTDSNSPLTATNFLGDGAIAAIPGLLQLHHLQGN